MTTYAHYTPETATKKKRKPWRHTEAKLAANHHMRLRSGTGETWHFGINIPLDLRDHFPKQQYVSFSLDTEDVIEARKLRDKHLAEWQQKFDKLRDAGENHHMRRSDGKSGNWCFYLWIPEDVRHHFDRSALWENLGTTNVIEARTKRDALLAEWKQRFADLRVETSKAPDKPAVDVAPAVADAADEELRGHRVAVGELYAKIQPVRPSAPAVVDSKPAVDSGAAFVEALQSSLSRDEKAVVRAALSPERELVECVQAVSSLIQGRYMKADEAKTVYHILGIDRLAEAPPESRRQIITCFNLLIDTQRMIGRRTPAARV